MEARKRGDAPRSEKVGYRCDSPTAPSTPLRARRLPEAVYGVKTSTYRHSSACAIISAVNRNEAISRLKAHEAELKRLGVDDLYMFCSTARGEASDDSDVDLFFDYTKGKLGRFELMDVKEYAASILGRKTDIMTRDSLHKTLRKSIEDSAVLVF